MNFSEISEGRVEWEGRGIKSLSVGYCTSKLSYFIDCILSQWIMTLEVIAGEGADQWTMVAEDDQVPPIEIMNEVSHCELN